MSLQRLPEGRRSPYSRPTGDVPSRHWSVSCWLPAPAAASDPAACQAPLLPAATATPTGKNRVRLAERFWKFARFLFFSVIYIHTDMYVCMYVCIYVCVSIYIFLVKTCYSFFVIFAWKPTNFKVSKNLEGGVFFLFQQGSHLPWQTCVF